jgi:hypothetical protein
MVEASQLPLALSLRFLMAWSLEREVRTPMTQILDCLVSYFALDESEQPSCQRYFCYHIFAGPGPTPGAGVVTITTVAIHDEAQRCPCCQHFHAVAIGGPAAAMAAALRYLDSYHESDHLRRVQSDFRGSDADSAATAIPGPARPRRASKGWTPLERHEPRRSYDSLCSDVA